MGRPLSRKYFGSNANNNIKVQFFNGTASVPGYIVKQKGARRFLCSDVNGAQALCRLVNKDAAQLLAGEMSITVKNDAGVVRHVLKISNHKVTTVDGSSPWSFSTSTTDGAVQIEEAGNTVANVPLTGNTNLEGDTEA